ncbi:hypothetical protein ACHQM5_012868 [Ranunculus cassubicifolius]
MLTTSISNCREPCNSTTENSKSVGGGGGYAAMLCNHDFSRGGGLPECDKEFHSNSESVVALTTHWDAFGCRCKKMITIGADNGKTATAKVVGECKSGYGCDTDIVNGSRQVWHDLRLNLDDLKVPVTWTDA